MRLVRVERRLDSPGRLHALRLVCWGLFRGDYAWLATLPERWEAPCVPCVSQASRVRVLRVVHRRHRVVPRFSFRLRSPYTACSILPELSFFQRSGQALRQLRLPPP